MIRRLAPLAPVAPVAPLLLAAALAYWSLWPFDGVDIGVFLIPWFDHIVAAGPVAAFAQPFANYAPPYLYLLALTTLAAPAVGTVTLIKLLSLAGTFALAAAVAHLVAVATHRDRSAPMRCAAITIALPSVMLNTAVLGQCDAMWAAACVMALAAGLRRRHVAMLAWCGLAFAIKLQAAFFAPFVLALLLQRRVPLRLWFVMPAVWLATLLPACLGGWPWQDALTIYLRQAETFPALALNAPSIWMIVQQAMPQQAPSLRGLAAAIAAVAGLAYVIGAARTTPSRRRLVELALLAPLLVVGLLPNMHERYFFLADVLALALAVAWPDRRSVATAVLVQLGSLLGLLAYMTGTADLAAAGAVAMLLATGLTLRPLRAGSALHPATA